jgi:hypothetical protein
MEDIPFISQCTIRAFGPLGFGAKVMADLALKEADLLKGLRELQVKQMFRSDEEAVRMKARKIDRKEFAT